MVRPISVMRCRRRSRVGVLGGVRILEHGCVANIEDLDPSLRDSAVVLGGGWRKRRSREPKITRTGRLSLASRSGTGRSLRKASDAWYVAVGSCGRSPSRTSAMIWSGIATLPVNAVPRAPRMVLSVRSRQSSCPTTGTGSRRLIRLSPMYASARGPVSISAIAVTRSRRCSASDAATMPPVECPTTVARRTSRWSSRAPTLRACSATR